MPRVLVTPVVLQRHEGPWRGIFANAGFEVEFLDPGQILKTPEDVIQRLQGMDAVLASTEPYTEEVFSSLKLRAIARMGVGYDSIDIAAATRHGVAITIAVGSNDIAVAEHTLALMLGVMRGFPFRDAEVRRGGWRRLRLPRLAGKTLGLYGCGRIGTAVAQRAAALGMRVQGFDPVVHAETLTARGIVPVSVDELLATSDVLSLHAPSGAATRHFINAQTLAKMKRGAVLINTARGSLVDEQALAQALASGWLLGAGLDVFEQEPPKKDNPLLQLENVLLSPHMAGLDDDSEEAMSRLAAQSLVDLFQGRWPTGHVVNEQLRQSWKW